MAHFDLEELPRKPQESMMQKSEASQLKGLDKSINLSPSTQQPNSDAPKDSVLYPIIEVMRTATLKRYDMLPPTHDNRDSFKAAMAEVEKKYGADKYAGPEAKALAYGIAPFLEGMVEKMTKEGWTFGGGQKQKTNKDDKKEEKKPEENKEPKPEPPIPMSNDIGKSPQMRAIK